MEPLEALVQPVDETLSPHGNLNVRFVSQSKARARRPIIGGGAWQCYSVETGTPALLEYDLVFPDEVSRSEFKVRVSCEVQITTQDSIIDQLSIWQDSTVGIGGQFEKQLRQDIHYWLSQHSSSSTRSISAILKNRTSLQDRLQEKLQNMGLQTKSLTVRLIPWTQEMSIELDEVSLPIRVVDYQGKLNVSLQGELERDESNLENYFTCKLPSAGALGDKPSVKQKVISAIQSALGGFSFQDWQSESADIQAAAEKAANMEAFKYGRRLLHRLYLKTGKEKPQLAENFSFHHLYDIPGVNRKLTVNHSGSYTLVNAGLLEQRVRANSNLDIAGMVENQVVLATERLLQKKTYSEAVQLLENRNDLESGVQSSLQAILAKYGYITDSCHVIVQSLPETHLVRGIECDFLPLPEEGYALSGPGNNPSLGFSGRLRLVEPERLEPYINGAETSADDLMKDIERVATNIVANFLRGIEPKDYLISDLAKDSNREEQLLEKLKERVVSGMLEQFGIEVSEITLMRGSDPVSNRIYELQKHRADLEANSRCKSISDQDFHDVCVKFGFFIVAPSLSHVNIYHQRALLDIEDQISQLELGLVAEWESVIISMPFESLCMDAFPRFREAIAHLIEASIEQQHGLVVSIDPNTIRSNAVSLNTSNELAQITRAIETLQKESTDLLIKDGLSEDEDVMDRYEQIQGRIKLLQSRREERSADIATAKTGAGSNAAVLATVKSLELRGAQLRIENDNLRKLVATSMKVARLGHTFEEPSEGRQFKQDSASNKKDSRSDTDVPLEGVLMEQDNN